MSLSREQANQTRDTVLTNLQQRSAQTTGLGRMANKVGVITGVGPAAGIGSQTARVFAREGARAIYLVDVSKDLPGFAEELGKIYPKTKVGSVICAFLMFRSLLLLGMQRLLQSSRGRSTRLSARREGLTSSTPMLASPCSDLRVPRLMVLTPWWTSPLPGGRWQSCLRRSGARSCVSMR